MKPLSYEEARRYIAGEDFDVEEYERQHIIALAKAVREASGRNGMNHSNLKNTAKRYLENHKNTKHRQELQELIDAYNSILSY